ncbi:MAG: DUF3048 domain-containing protein [Clostridia bacterium]|nr:DUF3048 domain-containing protein [Clostridia bacterium]
MRKAIENGKNIESKKILIIIAIIFVISILSISAVYYIKFVFNMKDTKNIVGSDINSNSDKSSNSVDEEPVKELPKQVQTFKGDDRTIAVMIDNEKPAWPHSGLADAYMIYEVIIEGGESRMLALYKGASTKKIGPVRSSRHYFVYYAMENNAIYSHYGWSPKAQSTILSNDVNNINGVTSDGKAFWRVGSGYHNAYTSIENLKNLASDKKYLTISNKESLYKYQAEEYDLKYGIPVANVYLKYSDLHNVSYEYDVQNKVFLRSMRGIKDVDRETKTQYFAKNIIIIQANNYFLSDTENKGRQELDILGKTGKGYYLTDGKYIEITWQKGNMGTKTYIYDKDGNEIILNDGITYFQVVPLGDNVKLT